MRRNKSALMKATDLLAIQEQSSTLLRRKLLARKYDNAEVDAAIDKLKQYHYINDAETCRRQFENLYAEGRLSVKQICVKLIQRGFDSEAINKLIPDDIYDHEYNAAMKLLTKKFSPESFDDSQARMKFERKLWQHLLSKGFDSEIIGAVVDAFLNQ